MNIRTKIPLYTSIIVFVSIAAITVFAILEYRLRTIESIENFKKEQIDIIKKQLEDNVNSACNILEKAMSQCDNLPHHTVKISEFPPELKSAVRSIEQIYFGDAGYIWINELRPPYTVIMHATKPEMNGTVQFFYIQDTKQNVYEAFEDVINKSGDAGFLQYDYYKPGTNQKIPKLSYIRLFKPLNWVVGTGVYIDYVDAVVAKKRLALKEQTWKLIFIIIVFSLVLLSAAFAGLFYFGKTISDSVNKVKQKLFDMSKGHIPNIEAIDRTDELGNMLNSLNELITGMNQYSHFALQIGAGNLNAEFKPLSADDKLGNSLLDMRNSIQKATEEEERRRIENEKISKANESYALFADIVRKESDNIADLSYNIINNIVEMSGLIQGGIFLLNYETEKPYLELTASVAYERRKFKEKKIFVGDGLIGACAYEKKKVYMTDIPDNYAEIRSGLGTASPKSILIVPLLTEDHLVGVIELAALKEMDDFTIQFIEKVSEIIAASLFTAKINAKTAFLQSNYDNLQIKYKKLSDTLLENDKEIKNYKRIINDLKRNKSILSA